MKTARWIRRHTILERDVEKRKEFINELESVFQSSFPEIMRYIANDYRVMIRDDQMWKDFKSPSWVGAVWSCGRALIFNGRSINSLNCLEHPKALYTTTQQETVIVNV